jgi:phosphoglycerate dehydrogenase-like enzyme
MGLLMQRSDYVVACLPLVPNTVGIINAHVFSQAKPNCVFINIGRGATVVESDLCDALQRRVIAGAALDVFAVEPLPIDSPLWKCDNLIISPHNADMIVNSRAVAVSLFVDNCVRYAQNLRFKHVVDKTLGY